MSKPLEKLPVVQPISVESERGIIGGIILEERPRCSWKRKNFVKGFTVFMI